jgi:hypothetical protein
MILVLAVHMIVALWEELVRMATGFGAAQPFGHSAIRRLAGSAEPAERHSQAMLSRQ